MAKMTHKGGLGKGLSSLLGEDTGTSESQLKLSMALVEPNQDQPRKVFDEQAMHELTESIRAHGVITPITVRERGNGYYQIIAGERRWRAARAAGLTEIPAHIIEVDDSEVMELALIENLQRQDLNPIEEAEGYDTLMRSCNLTQDQAATRVGKSRPAVANALRLLALPVPVRKMVSEGKLSGGHARTLLGIQDEALRAEAAEKIATMSVRQAESYVKKLNHKPKDAFSPVPEVDYVVELSKSLESVLGRKVTIAPGKNAGALTLEYYGQDDLERLCEALKNLSV